MHVDSSIELGRDDPALEFPWASEDGNFHYKDLKNNPALIDEIPEAVNYAELRDFLLRVNTPEFPLQTAKADIWTSDEIHPEEEIFAARQKLVSYVDLIFSAHGPRLSLESHLELVRKLCTLLQRAPEMAASIEFVTRRCYYHDFDCPAPDQCMRPEPMPDSCCGFCITIYVSGFGDTEQEARQRWSIALQLLKHALVQVARSNGLADNGGG